MHAYSKVHHEEKDVGGEGKPSRMGLEVYLKKRAYGILIMWQARRGRYEKTATELAAYCCVPFKFIANVLVNSLEMGFLDSDRSGLRVRERQRSSK